MSNEVFPSNFSLDELLKFVTIPDLLRTRIKELQDETERLKVCLNASDNTIFDYEDIIDRVTVICNNRRDNDLSEVILNVIN